MALFGTGLKYVPFVLPNSLKTAINPVDNKRHHMISVCNAALRRRNILNHKHDMCLCSKSRNGITCPITMAGGGKDSLQPTQDRPASLWDGISFSDDDLLIHEAHVKAAETLKEQVRTMVVDKTSTPKEKMILIDAVERLGVAYHFKQEIDQQIKHISEYQTEDGKEDFDLFTTALHFRLFRQHGYNVPSSVFDKFKDDDGTFKKTLVDDIKGLLSLYEATYVGCQGEHILKEARAFATLCLRNAAPLLDSGLKEHVTRALVYPLWCEVHIVGTHHYISFYDKQESKNELLLKLAKLNFNMLQCLYQKEIGELTKWWNQLNVMSKLSFVRNVPVQLYFCAVALTAEPQNAFARFCCTKIIQLIALVNDINGSADATYDELERFSEALQRWDIKQKDQLPGYLQIAYGIVFNTFEELNRELLKQGRCYALSYSREEFIKVNNSYLKKAKWYNGLETPTFQDIVSIAVDCSAINGTLAASFLGMQSASEEVFQWLTNLPKIVEASALYTRYINDIYTYTREHKDIEYPTTPIDFYMKEHHVSKQEAIEKFGELADEAWMAMNREWISTKDGQREFMELAFNYARIVFYFYGHGSDGFTNLEATIYEDMEAIFVRPIPID